MNDRFLTADAANQAAWDAFCAQFLLETPSEPVVFAEFLDSSPTPVPDSAEVHESAASAL